MTTEAIEVGVCDLCGRQLLRAPDGDVWHPWDLVRARPCPPEPWYDPTDPSKWIAWREAGNRTGHPGAEHWRPAS